MPRNLDTTLAAHLGDPAIQPCIFVELTLKSGVVRVWSGVGDFVGPGGNTFSGVGMLGGIGAIGENTEVKAEGTTVTLDGIGLTAIDIPTSPYTPPPPPRPANPGESIAWSYATRWSPPGVVNIPPSIWNGMEGVTGSDSATQIAGSATLTGGDVFADPTVGCLWSGFDLPPEIPADAVITDVYGVITVTTAGGSLQMAPPGHASPPMGVGTVYSDDFGSPGNVSIGASITHSLEGAATESFAASFVGSAVYYLGSPKSKMTMLQEALGDVRLGAPAKIWFGLMNNGALLGVPYLVFSGLVDKPSVHIGLDTLSITLALENRLVNLQRANQRRYTSADQKLYYPDDMAFNWVESLNDIALRWGN